MAQRALSAARAAAGTESPQDQPGQAGLPEGVLALDTQLERSSLQELLQTVMPNAAGGFDVVDHTSPVRVESFDWTGASTGKRTLPAELEDLGPMLQTEDAIYIAYGQSNPQEDDGREVYRVVKYSRTWERLGAASITGGESYTTQPFRASTHGALAEEDGTLVLHTGRLRYQSSDGLNHQSNFTAKIDASTMTVLETSSQFPDNHVSHSFAQYVLFDDGQVVYADHGDAYPRSFVLTVEGDFGSWQSCAQQDLLTFYAAIGDHTTNARPGGLGISETHYLFLGASAPQAGPGESYRDENVFLAAVPKDQFPHGEVELQWLTQLPAGQEWVERAVLVPLNNDTFLAMWETGAQEGEGSFSYAVFDGTGRQVGQTQTKEGFRAPDQITDPAVLEDTVLWTQEPLPQENEGGRGLRLYQLQVPLNAETAPAEEHTISLDGGPRQVALGETLQLTAQTTPASGPSVSWSSSDPWTASVSQTGLVAPRREGTVTITASAVYRGRTKTASCTVEVVPAAPELSLRLDAYARALEVGETFRLTAQTQPASGAAVSWRSSDPAVAAVSGGEVTARAPGRAEITATASYRGQTQTATCLVQVLEPEETQQPEEPPEEERPEEQPEQEQPEEQPDQDTGEAQRPGGTGGETQEPGGTEPPEDQEPEPPDQGEEPSQSEARTSYREDQANGDFVQVQVDQSGRVTVSGRRTLGWMHTIDSDYDTVVLSVAGKEAAGAYSSGGSFSVSTTVAPEDVRSGRKYIAVVICEGYDPAAPIMGLGAFQESFVYLELDENGAYVLEVD